MSLHGRVNKKGKNDKIRTGVSGVSEGNLCNTQACPRLA